MKKSLTLMIGLLFSGLIQAQNIDDTAIYIEKGKEIKGFSFVNPICNKNVLVDSWKYFIQKQDGKVKGGVINKITDLT